MLEGLFFRKTSNVTNVFVFIFHGVVSQVKGNWKTIKLNSEDCVWNRKDLREEKLRHGGSKIIKSFGGVFRRCLLLFRIFSKCLPNLIPINKLDK